MNDFGPIQAVPVSDLYRAADPHSAKKLTVVRGLRGYEDETSNWATNQVIQNLRKLNQELEIADLYLPMFKVLGGVSNDPEDDLFSPEDQFPALLEPLGSADMILFATRECCGFPDANVVRLLERLGELARKKSKENEGAKLFEGLPAGVIVSGCYGVHSAATLLAGALNKFGLHVVRHGLAFWDKKRGNPYKSNEFAANLELMARDLYDLCKALRR